MKFLTLILISFSIVVAASAQTTARRPAARPAPPRTAPPPAVPAPPSTNVTDAERVALISEQSNPECDRSPGGARNISTELYQAARQPGTTALVQPATSSEGVR